MKDIKSLIPHREPFLFIDKLIEANDEHIIGVRTFTKEDFFFPGHFPSYPVVPGVIMVEAMAQCGGAGLQQLEKIPVENLFFLATIKEAKFRKPTVPGDTIRFEIVNEKIGSRTISQSGKAFNADTVCAEARWMCITNPKETP